MTAAAVLAILGGHLVSPHLWYWAVATAWVVFVNAEHTGDILLRSGRRLIGTVAGVVFGYGLAVLAAGRAPLALAFLLACVMFYTPSGSYWAVTCFITGSLSMVLAVLHTLSPELLALRVLETVVGAGCGMTAAALVVPTSVRTVTETRLQELLSIIDRIVRGTPQPGAPKPCQMRTTSLISTRRWRPSARPAVPCCTRSIPAAPSTQDVCVRTSVGELSSGFHEPWPGRSLRRKEPPVLAKPASLGLRLRSSLPSAPLPSFGERRWTAH